jgi:hypothetical protein
MNQRASHSWKQAASFSQHHQSRKRGWLVLLPCVEKWQLLSEISPRQVASSHCSKNWMTPNRAGRRFYNIIYISMTREGKSSYMWLLISICN